MRFTILAVATVAVSLTACQTAAPEPVGLTEADRAAIEATSTAFVDAFLKGDAAAIAATYTEDAMLLPPNAPAAEGRAAIEAEMASFPPVTQLELHNAEVEGAGDTAYVVGTYTMTFAPEGADPIPDSGKYMEIRKKQADGSWLLYRDIFNSDLPAAPAAQ